MLLKAAANAAGIPVVLTNVEYGPQGAEGGQFFRKVPALRNFFKGSPLGAFADGMEPGEGDVVLRVDGRSVADAAALRALIRSAPRERRFD